MAQTGFTPIQLYYSSTTTNAPLAANLASGELAINITDGKLFYKDNANAVQVIGWKTVPATAGGTGQTSYAVGDLLYANTTTTLAKLADVATGNALISGGVGVAPLWGKIGLTTHVSGTLPTANGGTNLTSFTANGVVYASSTSALATGSALTFNGSVLNSTGTITAPNLQGPTFSSYLSTGQTITGSTYTKVLFDTTLWNSGNFASSRFTPTVAGYYQVNLMVVGQNANTGVFTSIYKNGTAYKNAGLTMASPYVLVSGLVYLNGSTDYIEGYTYIIAATPIVSTASYFDACLVRS